VSEARALIAPSILSADFARLGEEIAMCEAGGADWIHVDVMDGRFVPNLTFGCKVIETVRRVSALPIDVHMMVLEPERYIDEFAGAGASVLTIHPEATHHPHRQLARIRELGCRAGLAIDPGTPLEHARELVAEIDLLLVMSVNPGFGGQRFIPSSLDKIGRARRLLREAGSGARLEVDGGIGRETIGPAHAAGAEVFVAGHAIFGADDPRSEIGELRARCRPRGEVAA
jgi:ribulose-phosphate 3-epimerase